MRNRWILMAAFAFVAILVWQFRASDNSIYNRKFGDHRVKIWISANDSDSVRQKICGSYHLRSFIEVYVHHSVEIPANFETPTFSKVVDESNQLIGIYETTTTDS